MCIVDKTPDARLAPAAPLEAQTQAAAPVRKESRKVDEYVESEEDANDPRSEFLTICRDEHEVLYHRKQPLKCIEIFSGYELDDKCLNPSFFRVTGQNKIAQQYELPLDLIKEHGLVTYLLRNKKDRSHPPTIWVRDIYGHIVQLQWIPLIDSTVENTYRINAMRRPANRKVRAYAKLPEVIPIGAEVTPAQVTAVDPQEEAIQTSSEKRLEFLEHLGLQELDSKFKAGIAVGLHDDCWTQNFKTEERQDALAKRFGLPLELMNRLAGAIVLTEKGYPWIETSIGRRELLKQEEPDRLAKAENRKLAEEFLQDQQIGRKCTEQEPGDLPKQADEPVAGEICEPDF